MSNDRELMRHHVTAPTAMWQGTVWEVYAPLDQGGLPPLLYRRAIAAVSDGGRWTFSESGSRFPFEVAQAYELRRKRDRFNRELLYKYLAHFGLRPFSNDFYKPSGSQPAIIVERTRRWPEPATQYSLEEVVNGVPWKSDAT